MTLHVTVPVTLCVLCGTMHSELILYTAGAARGNPGRAGAGAVLLYPPPRVFCRSYRYLGVRTNNESEYEALMMGLRCARQLGFRRVALRSSSELVINQMAGTYMVRNVSLQRLHLAAWRLLQDFDHWQAEHVPRADNAAAHRLATKAIAEYAQFPLTEQSRL